MFLSLFKGKKIYFYQPLAILPVLIIYDFKMLGFIGSDDKISSIIVLSSVIIFSIIQFLYKNNKILATTKFLFSIIFIFLFGGKLSFEFLSYTFPKLLFYCMLILFCFTTSTFIIFSSFAIESNKLEFREDSVKVKDVIISVNIRFYFSVILIGFSIWFSLILLFFYYGPPGGV